MIEKSEMIIKSLEHGWADLCLSFDDYETTFYFEYVPNDPLYDLLISAIRIPISIDSLIIFPNCSQREYMSVKKLENGFCRIEIEADSFDLSIKQYCKMILRMFDKFVFTYSKEEFIQHWGGFPDTEIERLRDIYHSM
jgi:hypothetical protein